MIESGWRVGLAVSNLERYLPCVCVYGEFLRRPLGRASLLGFLERLWIMRFG